ncbi:MAG: hypothetical protein U0350_32350 [Caldilineaceae bacterium]
MLRTLEALIDEQGDVQLLEAIQLPTKYRALVTILETTNEESTLLRPFGLCAGEFTVPEDFNEPLPDEILAEFEGL